MTYRPEIDGLRAIAVLSVLLCHAGLSVLSGGFAGVDVFFVISGFLITRILADDLAAGQFSLWRFYERRARRILPALMLVVAVTIAMSLTVMVPFQMRDFADSVIGVALFLSNIVFFLQSGYFAADAAAKPLLHTWSLAVEEQFYILFPLLIWSLWRFGLRRLAWVFGGVALISLGAAEYGWRAWPEANFYLIPFRAWELLAGSLAALFVLWRGVQRSDLLAGAGMILILGPMLAYDETVPFPSLWTLVPVLGTALVLVFAGAGTWVARLLALRPVVWVGLISYSVYLWHQPLLAFARLAGPDDMPAPVMLAVALLALPLGWASWRFVEQPFRGRDALFTQRGMLALSAASLVGLAALGSVLIEVSAKMPVPAGALTVAQTEAFKKERLAIIGEGTCHLRDKGDFDRFLAAWDCRGRDAQGAPAQVALFGDSHGGDTAGAIRLAGQSVLQMTGAECPLLPGIRQRPHCDALMDRVIALARAEKIDAILLVNYFTARELDDTDLQAIFDFWSAQFERVYLLTPSPNFDRFDVRVQETALADLRDMRPAQKVPTKFKRLLAKVDTKGVIVLDAFDYFCPDQTACSPIGVGPLVTDGHHMTAEGMLAYGQQLVADPAGPFGAAAQQ